MVNRLLLLLLLTATPAIQAAELNAAVDRKILLTTEHIMLTITLSDSDTRLRAEGLNPNIDLTALNKDFDLGAPQSQHHYKIQRHQGRPTSNLQIALFPKRHGTLIIPPFSVDGLSSQAIKITVHQAAKTTTPEVFVRSGSQKTTLWNREQTLVFVDLYQRIELKSAKLGGHLETTPVNIGVTTLTHQTRDEIVNDINYKVTRNAWLLTPQISGRLQIDFPDIWLETLDQRRLRLPATQTILTVKALPKTVPTSILIGQPHFEQTLQPATIKPEELTTWEIKLHAPSQIASLSATRPKLVFPDNFTVYHEDPQRLHIANSSDYSTVVYRLLISVNEAGVYTLPNIELPYFDTTTGQLALMIQNGPTLNVTARHTISSTDKPIIASDSSARSNTLIWQRAIAIFALLWVIGLFFLWNKKRRETR